MNMKRKLIGIVGALALTMSMTAGIVSAQETLPLQLEGSSTMTLVVNCGAENAGTGSLTLSAAGGADSVAFGTFDPSNPTTVSTPPKALRVDVAFGNCPGAAWSVTAAVTDFTSGTDVISSQYFQLPIGEPNSSAGWTTDGTTPAGHVTGPDGIVAFDSSGAATTNLASPSGTGTASGTMFMEFSAQMAGLPNTIADGDYAADFTVTFNASNP